MHVYLTGFMGSGKTTVGRILAANLHRPFVDLDAMIEVQEGETIVEIFRTGGESRFRGLEAATLRSVDDSVAAVIATGGGILSIPGNREWMAGHGITVWLDAPFDVVLDRLNRQGVEKRPLFEDEAQARALFDLRRMSYRDSDRRIEVLSSDSAADVAAKIEAALEDEPCDT